MQQKRLDKQILTASLTAGTAGIVGAVCMFMPIFRGNYRVEEKIQNVDTTRLTPPRVLNPLTDLCFRTDTLEQSGTAPLYYQNGKVVRNFVDKDNRYQLSLPYFVHEWWHSQIDQLHFRTAFLLTPYEYFKLCAHNEIAANLAALLTARYEYLAADNTKQRVAIIRRYENTYLGFYFKAIKQGKIRPENSSPVLREKEWRFIANGVRDMWMKKFSRHYLPGFRDRLQSYYQRFGDEIWQKKVPSGNYRHLLKGMYTLGGVNFYAYMDKDIDYPDDKVILADNIRKVKSLRVGGRGIMQHIEDALPLLSNVAMDKQTEALQNILIAARLKVMLHNAGKEKVQRYPGLITIFYHKIKNEMERDAGFKKLVHDFPAFSQKRLKVVHDADEYAQTIRQIYQYDGVELQDYINNFAADNVPVSEQMNSKDWEQIGWNSAYIPDNVTPYQMWNLVRPECVMPLTPYIVPYRAEAPNISYVKRRRQRLSDWQYLAIPNFKQPILLDETHALPIIKEEIKKFNDIPLELKQCDTDKQRKFIEQNPDYQLPFVRPTAQK